MREYATPLDVDVPGLTSGRSSLSDDVVRNGEEHPDAVVLARRRPGGERRGDHHGDDGDGDDDRDEDRDEDRGGWDDVTAAQFLAEVRGVAKGLLAAGVEVGDRVALLSSTRYEWTLLDYAIWFVAAVTVPVYETASDEQVEWILADSGARAVVVETPGHLARVTRCRERLDDLHQVWSIDGGAVDVLTRLGADIEDADLEARRRTPDADSLATLIYTSGTTGRPKGCMLTHGNLLFETTVTADGLRELFCSPDATTLLFLPLAHVFARVVQVGCIRNRVRLGHSADITHLREDLARFRPTFVLAVPRVFEKLFNNASQRAVADGRGRVFSRAADVAIAWSRAQEGSGPSLALRAQHRVLDRLVYARLRDSLGGSCAYAVSGGAPLGERLGHFYRGVGVQVLEGYGLSETTAALSVNLPDAQKVGTVGRPLPGTEVRVAEDGELLFRGAQVFTGYWGDEAASASATDPDGWFHTGDVGEIDDEGFIRVTGRQTEILVTAGGKNVAPAVLEDRLRAAALVDQCIVVGDGRPFVAALVTIDPDAFAPWAAAHGRPADVAASLTDPDLLAEVGLAVEEANRAVSRAEAIRKFAVLGEEWTEEGGQLTPSLKLRRSVVMREAHEDVERLYRP